MDRRRSGSYQQKRYYQLTISILLLIINIVILICFLKANDVLYRPNIYFWVYGITGVFIASKLFMIYSFYTEKPLLLDLTSFLCVILLIFQIPCALVASFSIVINADANAENTTSNYPNEVELVMEARKFAEKNECCFKVLGPETSTGRMKSVFFDQSRHKDGENTTCDFNESCARVNKIKARNVAVVLITGYILIIIGLTMIIMLIIL